MGIVELWIDSTKFHAPSAIVSTNSNQIKEDVQIRMSKKTELWNDPDTMFHESRETWS